MLRNALPREVIQRKKKWDTLKKIERERIKEDKNYIGLLKTNFQSNIARMIILLRSADKIIKFKIERGETKEKGKKFEENPIVDIPIFSKKGVVIKEDVQPESSKTTTKGKGSVVAEQGQKLEERLVIDIPTFYKEGVVIKGEGQPKASKSSSKGK